MKIKTIKIKSKELLMQLMTRNGDISINYCVEDNAGDSFNKDFINDYFHKKVRKFTIGNCEHYLFCGSVLSRANKESIIIGAGLISDNVKFKRFKKLVGCRGKLTLERINMDNPELKPVFMGDPGLMVKEIFSDVQRKPENIIGVIPHFVDYEKVVQILGDDNRFMIINIKADYKKVCADIMKCHTVLSSSLHGLIFSDGLSVKNNWVKFSDNIVGGDFKFRDYYSVMDIGKDKPVFCKSTKDIENAVLGAFVSSNPNYNTMLDTICEHFG